MSAAPEPRLTAEEYIAFERASQTKHMFINGELFAMAGAGRVHNRIAGNVFRRLDQAFDDRPCEAFTNNMRVSINAANSYFYPDVVATCQPLTFADDVFDTLTNPQVIAEVISPSTEKFDRREKLQTYQQLPLVEHIVLIAQDRPLVECYSRTDAGVWEYWSGDQMNDELNLPAVDCSISFEHIYARVEFPRDEHGQFTIIKEMRAQYLQHR